MHRGVKLLATVAVLSAAGCGGSGAPLEIRASKVPLSATAKPLPARIAEGYASLGLGSVALAIESFRKALREQPDSSEAMAGLAASYDRMARFDLSRRYYESALALAPSDTRLLGAFAASLDAQGNAQEAAAVRAEIQVRLAAAAPPPPAPAAPAEMVAEAVAPVELAGAAVEPPPATSSEPVVLLPSAAKSAATVALLPPASSSDTVALPPPTPLPVVDAPIAIAALVPPAAPLTVRHEPVRERPVQLAARVEAGPRLERMSPGEVALVTMPRPQWRTQTVRRTATSTTLRFVPLRSAAVTAPTVRLLNAARHHRLAFNTRSYLAQRGWRQIVIGDADRVRQTSLILYPAARRATAERLAAQFGFAIARRASGSEIVMLLGRDSITRAHVKRG